MTKARGCCRPVSFVVGLLLAGFLSGCGSPALDGPGDDAASSTHDEGSEDEDEPGGGDATSDERGGGAGGSTDDEASTGGAPGTVTRSVSARWLIAQPTRRSRNGKARVGRPYRTGTTRRRAAITNPSHVQNRSRGRCRQWLRQALRFAKQRPRACPFPHRRSTRAL